jgi:hypothetical protein
MDQFPSGRRELKIVETLVRESEGNNEVFGTKIPYILLKYKIPKLPLNLVTHISSLTSNTSYMKERVVTVTYLIFMNIC